MTSKQPKMNLNGGTEAELQEERIRLSMKGALRESGGHSQFEVRVDPNSTTAEFEKEKMLLEQLESVDFFIEQGFLDVAFNALERLDRVFSNNPMIMERLDRMAQLELDLKSGKVSSPSAVPEVMQIPSPSSYETQQTDFEPEDLVTEKPESSSDMEMIFEVALITDEVPVITDEVPVLSEPPEALEDTPEAMPEAMEDTHEALGDTVETPLSESEPEPESEIEEESEPPARDLSDVQHSLETLIQEMQEDPAEIVEPDFQIHYNVGLSYLEIELVDDAIEEFQAAYRCIQAAGQVTAANPYCFRCCMMLGESFRIKGMPRATYVWLKRALEIEGLSEPDHYQASYEIAWVYEELGEPQRALDAYEEIARSNPDYENVKEEIERLRGLLNLTPDN